MLCPDPGAGSSARRPLSAKAEEELGTGDDEDAAAEGGAGVPKGRALGGGRSARADIVGRAKRASFF